MLPEWFYDHFLHLYRAYLSQWEGAIWWEVKEFSHIADILFPWKKFEHLEDFLQDILEQHKKWTQINDTITITWTQALERVVVHYNRNQNSSDPYIHILDFSMKNGIIGLSERWMNRRRFLPQNIIARLQDIYEQIL